MLKSNGNPKARPTREQESAYLFRRELHLYGPDKLHLCDASMRGHDLPAVVKLLRVQGGVTHHLLLRTRERDRASEPPRSGLPGHASAAYKDLQL
jgi:hypothetical protein